MLSKSLLAIATILVVAFETQAQGQLVLGQPIYGGNGCPAGTATALVSPDNTAITVLFDQFIAEAGRTTGRRIDRKSCNLAVPVQVPNGYSVAIFTVDYRGANILPRGAQSRLDAEYFWAGARGPRISRTFTGPVNDVYNVRDELLASTLVWTPCGASVNLRVNASMMAQANANMDQTIATVDSADVSSELIYHIRFRRCF